MAKITIEELSDSLKEYLNGLGLTEEQVQGLINMLEDEKIGETDNLSTIEKNKLVNAINEVYQSGDKIKQEMIAILASKGLNVNEDVTTNELIYIANNELIIPVGDALIENVLTGKTFINNTGQLLTGTMVNQGSKTITPKSTTQTLPAGYYSGITINGDSDLIAANIKSGVNIFGVTGTAPITYTISSEGFGCFPDCIETHAYTIPDTAVDLSFTPKYCTVTVGTIEVQGTYKDIVLGTFSNKTFKKQIPDYVSVDVSPDTLNTGTFKSYLEFYPYYENGKWNTRVAYWGEHSSGIDYGEILVYCRNLTITYTT